MYLRYVSLLKKTMKKNLYFSFLSSFFITYISLFIPRAVDINRPDIMGCEKLCTVVAGGFPLPYLIDGYNSPIGTISKNPLIILFTNTDTFLIENYILDYIFWFFIMYILLNFVKNKLK